MTYEKCPYCRHAVPLTKTGKFVNHDLGGVVLEKKGGKILSEKDIKKGRARCPRSGSFACKT